MERPQRFWNPYLAGVALGLVLLGSFVVLGRGLGASGGAYRLGVFLTGAHHAGGHPLAEPIVYGLLGVFLGGALGAYSAGRLGRAVLRGPRIGVAPRLALALTGGVLMGVAARFARGCTSGQALSGGALGSLGAWVFMFSVFAGGYALARLVRRQWT